MQFQHHIWHVMGKPSQSPRGQGASMKLLKKLLHGVDKHLIEMKVETT